MSGVVSRAVEASKSVAIGERPRDPAAADIAAMPRGGGSGAGEGGARGGLRRVEEVSGVRKPLARRARLAAGAEARFAFVTAAVARGVMAGDVLLVSSGIGGLDGTLACRSPLPTPTSTLALLARHGRGQSLQ